MGLELFIYVNSNAGMQSRSEQTHPSGFSTKKLSFYSLFVCFVFVFEVGAHFVVVIVLVWFRSQPSS